MASVNASHDDDDDAPVDSINITPLVDVLMVVLVMFILTATAQVSGIQIHLPKASASVSLSEAKTKAISVNDGGQVVAGTAVDLLAESGTTGTNVEIPVGEIGRAV